jgi:hypothetical protein
LAGSTTTRQRSPTHCTSAMLAAPMSSLPKPTDFRAGAGLKVGSGTLKVFLLTISHLRSGWPALGGRRGRRGPSITARLSCTTPEKPNDQAAFRKLVEPIVVSTTNNQTNFRKGGEPETSLAYALVEWAGRPLSGKGWACEREGAFPACEHEDR